MSAEASPLHPCVRQITEAVGPHSVAQSVAFSPLSLVPKLFFRLHPKSGDPFWNKKGTELVHIFLSWTLMKSVGGMLWKAIQQAVGKLSSCRVKLWARNVWVKTGMITMMTLLSDVSDVIIEKVMDPPQNDLLFHVFRGLWHLTNLWRCLLLVVTILCIFVGRIGSDEGLLDAHQAGRALAVWPSKSCRVVVHEWHMSRDGANDIGQSL